MISYALTNASTTFKELSLFLIGSALQHRSEIFSEAYTGYLTCREDYLTTLSW